MSCITVNSLTNHWNLLADEVIMFKEVDIDELQDLFKSTCKFLEKYSKDELVPREIGQVLFSMRDFAWWVGELEEALVSRCFDKQSKKWAESEIRQWLNTEFYDEAFSTYEKFCIQTTEVKTTDWIWYNDNIYTQTQDKIFLLGADEVEKYFPEQSSRVQEKSDYANHTLEEDRKYTNAWWLRNEGSCSNTTTLLVLEDGSFYDLAGSENLEGIRPAMRILKNYGDFVVLDGQMNLFNEGT